MEKKSEKIIGQGQKDYNLFAKAAKDAGFDKDERKQAAARPATLFEGTSSELKKYLSPEMLIFFSMLCKATKMPKASISGK